MRWSRRVRSPHQDSSPIFASAGPQRILGRLPKVPAKRPLMLDAFPVRGWWTNMSPDRKARAAALMERAVEDADGHCEYCLRLQPFRDRLEAAPLWTLTGRTQRLTGFASVCPACAEVQALGFKIIDDKISSDLLLTLDRMIWVNQWPRSAVDAHLGQTMKALAAFVGQTWTLNLDLLADRSRA